MSHRLRYEAFDRVAAGSSAAGRAFYRVWWVFLASILFIVIAILPATSVAQTPDAPLSAPGFIENAGQWRPEARFMYERGPLRVWFGTGGILYDLAGPEGGHLIRVSFGSGAVRRTAGEGRLPGNVSFLGPGGPRGFTAGIFDAVRMEEVAPGVTARFRRQGEGLKYDLLVAPGADPDAIRLSYDGATGLSIEPEGALSVRTSVGVLREEPPYCYQVRNGRRVTVSSRYILDDRGLGFLVGDYDPTLELVIDPTLAFSSYLGGVGAEGGRGTTIGEDGDIYVTGFTRSVADFPTTVGAYQRSLKDQLTQTSDLFVSRFDPTGRTLRYSTYVGGRGSDEPASIVVNARNEAFVVGTTSSTDFPVTSGAYTTSAPGGTDGFLLTLNATGTALLNSTYIGGRGEDHVEDIGLDLNGAVYLVGWTLSIDFPITPGTVAVNRIGGADAFALKLDAGRELAYGTYLGGTADDRAIALAMEPGGEMFITGSTSSGDFMTTPDAYSRNLKGDKDGFLLRLRHDATSLLYGTLFGGIDRDEPNGIALDDAGRVHIVGETASPDYPQSPSSMNEPAGSWFATKFDRPLLATMVYSRYIGPTGRGAAMTVKVDRGGNACIGGYTEATASPPFPRTADALPSGPRGGLDLAFVQLGQDGSLRHASVIGGNRDDIMARISAVNASGDLYVTGTTGSRNLPTTPFAFDRVLNETGVDAPTDAFLMRFRFGSGPVAVAPPSRNLDTLRCEKSRRDTFWVYNRGESPLVLTSQIFRVGTPPVFRVIAPVSTGPVIDPPRTVPPGDSIQYIVEFLPTSDRSYSDTLLIQTDDQVSGNPLRVAYYAARAAPTLSTTGGTFSMRVVRPCHDAGFTTNVFIRNSGVGSVTTEDIVLAGGSAGPFRISRTPQFPVTIRERDSVAVGLVVFPAGTTAGRVYRDTLIVSIRECSEPFTIPLTVTVDSAGVAIAESEITFPPVAFCGSSSDTTVTLINTGTVALTLLPSNLEGSGFSVIGGLPILLGPGESRKVTLRFTPPAPAGLHQAFLTWEGLPCNVLALTTLRGERLERGGLTAGAAELDFPKIAACREVDASSEIALTLFNPTSDPASVASPVLSGPFAQVDPSLLPAVMEGGASLEIRLRYTRPTPGFDTGEIVIPYTIAGCDDVLRIVLRGGRFDLVVEPSALLLQLPELGQCMTSFDTTFVLHNKGGEVMTLALFERTAGVDHLAPALPRDIPAGDSVLVAIRFAPVKAGEATERLVYRTEPCGESVVVDLRGTKRGAVILFSEHELLFPTRLSCVVGASEAVALLANSGDSPVPTGVAEARIVQSPGGPFSLSVDPVGSTISSGGSLEIPVTFDPVGPGTFGAVLEIVLEPCGDTVRLPIVGRVADPVLTSTPGVFGTVPVGGSTRLTITVTSETPAAITVDSLLDLGDAFTIVSSNPPFPVVLDSGESFEVVVEFAPLQPKEYSITALAGVIDPCTIRLPIPLQGFGRDSVREVPIFCLAADHSLLAGDTVELTVTASPDGIDPTTGDIEYMLTYDRHALQPIGVEPAVVEMLPADPDEPGVLRLLEKDAGRLRPAQLRVRFVALASGTEEVGNVRLREVRFTSGEEPGIICDDSASIRISTRCVIGGMTKGSFPNRLENAVPNPASEVVEISYQQLENARATLTIFDQLGREVSRPLDQDLTGGRYTVRINVADLPAGRYLYTLSAGLYSESRWLVIIR